MFKYLVMFMVCVAAIIYVSYVRAVTGMGVPLYMLLPGMAACFIAIIASANIKDCIRKHRG